MSGDVNGGGGILNHGGLTVSDSIISNSSARLGGGICNFYSMGLATLTITNCTVSGNSGGGISNLGEGASGPGGVSSAKLTVSNCTISGNSASNGGGIYNLSSGAKITGSATVAISNSTLSGNSATGAGGASYNLAGGHFPLASVNVNNSPISANSASTGGGILLNGGTSQIGDTVLNAGASGGTISIASGTVTSLGYNLASDNGGGVLTGPGDQINTDPMLGPLQDNGGPTFTQALLPGSPAINAGNPTFIPPPFVDQRGPGFRRVRHGRIDIGSFEVQRQH